MQVCFIGHRDIERTSELENRLRQTVEELIIKGATTFLFGSKSDFDTLAWETVTQLKQKYPFIKRVYVRSAFQYISSAYEEYLLTYYERTYFPERAQNAGKCSYIKRNYEMIDCCLFCVFYYNPNYLTPLKKPPKNSISLPKRRTSGTKIAFNYAVKSQKQIINLFDKNSTV